ncbi:MAG: hypothetical protein GXN99_03405 [Candidatus Nanohaloarchaeota archaeon]|nr:hypothetical protein [Candidatus Nanohaloarchaeota archaeon]
MKKQVLKKGVSPLIAAVLLIVFTVAIGAVVLNWMTSYTKGTTETAGTDTSSTIQCAKQIIVIENVTKSNGQVIVRAENQGSADATISSIILYDANSKSCETTGLAHTIPAGGYKIIEVNNTACDAVDNTSYTVRISTDCGASDTFLYPTGK